VLFKLHGNVTSNPTMLRLKTAEHRTHHHAGVVAEVTTGLADEVYLNGVQHLTILSRL
jgi:hypothetical protein